MTMNLPTLKQAIVVLYRTDELIQPQEILASINEAHELLQSLQTHDVEHGLVVEMCMQALELCSKRASALSPSSARFAAAEPWIDENNTDVAEQQRHQRGVLDELNTKMNRMLEIMQEQRSVGAASMVAGQPEPGTAMTNIGAPPGFVKPQCRHHQHRHFHEKHRQRPHLPAQQQYQDRAPPVSREACVSLAADEDEDDNDDHDHRDYVESSSDDDDSSHGRQSQRRRPYVPPAAAPMAHLLRRPAPRNVSRLIGLESIQQSLVEMVSIPRLLPPAMLVFPRHVPRSALLHGPPGTGKTTLAEFLAADQGLSIIHVSPSTVFSKWTGDAELKLSQLFAAQARNAPCLLFFDEVDALVGSSSSSRPADDPNGDNDSVGASRLRAEFLILMTKFKNGDQSNGNLVLAATNRINRLDRAVLRRFDRKVHVDKPGECVRRKLLDSHLATVEHTLTAEDMTQVSESSSSLVE